MADLNIKVITVCVLVSTILITGAHCKGNGKGKGSGTSSTSSEEVCEEVNTTDCLLDWETFKASVVNTIWIGIYGVRRDNIYIMNDPYKPKILWELLPGGEQVGRMSQSWNGIDEICIYEDDNFVGGKNNLAQMEVAVDMNTIRVERVASTNPDKFILYSVCFSEKCSGICPNALEILLIKDQRYGNNTASDVLLDGLPWCEIKENLDRCFNLTFVGPPDMTVKWIWQGEEC